MRSPHSHGLPKRAGRCSRRCGPTDRLFGIERTGAGKAKLLDRDYAFSYNGNMTASILRNNCCDSEIKATTASV